jgi:hypothetical protein
LRRQPRRDGWQVAPGVLEVVFHRYGEKHAERGEFNQFRVETGLDERGDRGLRNTDERRDVLARIRRYAEKISRE